MGEFVTVFYPKIVFLLLKSGGLNKSSDTCDENIMIYRRHVSSENFLLSLL